MLVDDIKFNKKINNMINTTRMNVDAPTPTTPPTPTPPAK